MLIETGSAKDFSDQPYAYFSEKHGPVGWKEFNDIQRIPKFVETSPVVYKDGISPEVRKSIANLKRTNPDLFPGFDKAGCKRTFPSHPLFDKFSAGIRCVLAFF